MAEADAVIGDGQGARVAVRPDIDPVVAVAGGQIGIRDGGVPQLVACVGGVGDQLAQENFLFAVQRIGDDVEEAADFGLELMPLASARGFICRCFCFCFGHGEIPKTYEYPKRGI